MRKKSISIFIAIASWSLSAASFTNGKILLEGTVKSFDSKSVKMRSGSKDIVIPRSLVLASDLKTGSSVRVEISSADISSLKFDK